MMRDRGPAGLSQPLDPDPRRTPEARAQDRRRRRRAALAPRTGSGVAPALRQLQARLRALAGGRRRPRARVAARLHHRLQQHQRLEAGLRLRGRMGTAEPGWRGAVRPRRRPGAVQQRDRRPPQPPAQHDPDRQRRAGVRRPDERRLQAHRPQRDRRVQARLPSPLPGPRQRGYRGRGPAARSHEHRRQAGPPRRTHPLRRLRLDADRRLGREQRHARPRRPRLRHATALRAGRRARAAPPQLRAERRRAVRPRVRRGLRRAVLVHPRVRRGDRRRSGSAADARPRPARSRAGRDRVPQPHRLPLRLRAAAADRGIRQRVAAVHLHPGRADRDDRRIDPRRGRGAHAGGPAKTARADDRLPPGAARAGAPVPRRRRGPAALGLPLAAAHLGPVAARVRRA